MRSKQTGTSRHLIVAMGAALGLNGSWVVAVFQSLNIFAFFDESEPVLDAVYLVSIVAISLTLLIMGVFEHRAGQLLAWRPLLWLCAIVMGLSTALMPLGGLPAPEGGLVIAVAGVASGISSGIVLMYLGMALSRLSLHEAVASVAIGQIASPVLFSLTLFLPSAGSLACACLLPFLTAIALHRTVALIHLGDGNEAIAPLNRQQAPEDADEHRQIARLVFRIALCVGLVNFAHELMRTLYIQIDLVSSGNQLYAVVQCVASTGAIIGAVAIALAMMSVRTLAMPRLCYWGITLFLMMGILLGPAPLLFSRINSFVPYTVNQAADSCFGLFMWIMTAALCQRFSSTRVRTFAFIRAGWALGPLAGLLLGRLALTVGGLAPATVYACMLVAVLAVFFAMGAVLNERVLMETMDILPLERRERFQDKCRHIIERYGLSEREGEIMIMFAKGRNLDYIQEELFISKSTVSTHRQHIYKKLGIHSQQELLDLVQAVDPYGK